MKETTKMSRAVSQLEHIYNALNTDFLTDCCPCLIGRSSLPPFIRTGAAGGTAQAGAQNGNGERRPSSTRKLICPKCGQSVRVTKTVNILCGNCLLKMLEV